MIRFLKVVLLSIIFCMGIVKDISASVRYQAKNYNGSYVSSPGQITLTADSPNILQQIQNATSVGNWGVNNRVGAFGTVRTFAGKGSESDTVNAMIIQPDSSIVVAGATGTFASRGFMSRFLANGVADTNFGTGGSMLFSCPGDGGVTVLHGISSDGSGGYYTGGYINFGAQGFIGHVTSAGAVDTTFGTSGFLKPAGIHDVAGIALQSTGAIVYVGATGGLATNGFSVKRLTPAGVLDTNFTTYTATTMHAYAIAIDSQDRIIVAGTTVGGGSTVYVYRINQNGGGVDPTFNNGAPYTVAGQVFGGGLVLLPDDSIIVAGGNGTVYKIYKLTSAGVPDTSFGNGTGLVSYQPVTGGSNIAQGVGLVPDGRIAVTGSAFNGTKTWYGTLLLNADGSLNQYFSIPGQSSAVGPGGAAVQIPVGSSTSGSRVGYQGSTPSTGLVVVGSSTSGYFGMIFYTDLGAGV